MGEVELTILMPCLNEEKTIEICIKKAKEFLKKNNINGEVLIADNGSTDQSPIIAEKNGASGVCAQVLAAAPLKPYFDSKATNVTVAGNPGTRGVVAIGSSTSIYQPTTN